MNLKIYLKSLVCVFSHFKYFLLFYKCFVLMNRKIELNKVVANRLYNEPNQFKVVIFVSFIFSIRSVIKSRD